MRHAATALSLCIALISGVVLALWLGQPPLRSLSIQAETSSEVEETALAFYRAVDTYLAGGDDAPLRRLLHPDFVDHGSGSSAGGNAATFLQQLGSIRDLYPGIQLSPKVASVGSNAASVSLSLSDRQRRSFAGMEIDPVDVIGRLDLVRIERRLIVERWSSAPMAGELEAYPALEFALPFALHTMVARVQQISLDGAAEPMTDPFGHLLLIVQSGRMRLDILDSVTTPAVIWRMERGRVVDPVPIDPWTIVPIDRMEAVLLPAGTRFHLWDDSSEGAGVLALEFGPQVNEEVSSSMPHFVDELEETLWSGISLADVGNRLTLSVGRATLLPQATLSSDEIEGLQLSWVSGGSVDMSASSGTARVRDASGVRSQLHDGQAMLQAGDAGAVGPGANVDYRATGNGPATVWFFSLVPASAQTSQPQAGAPTPIPTAPPPRTAS